MKYNFDEIVERRGTNAIKWDMGWDHQPASGEDYIPMWIADMDFACAPEIVSAIKAKADERIFGYSSTPADYRTKVVDFYARRHGFRPAEEEIVFTEGVVSALQYVIRALTEPGDKVIIQPPVYPPFFSSVEQNGRELLENPLIRHEDNSYDIDWEDLEEKAADPQAKILLVCSPHNPVGRIWTEEELRRLRDVCKRHDLLFLCDEIHNDLIRSGNAHVSAKKLFPEDEQVIVCTAPTKTFNLAGLGASHMFCYCKEAREKILAVTGNQSPNPFTAAAVMAAYTACDEWLDEANAYMDGNFALFYDLCARYFPKAVPAPTQGTYLAWLDVRAYVGEETAKLEKDIYDRCGVYVECGDAFGGKGFLRINLACPAAYITEAFERAAKEFGGENK